MLTSISKTRSDNYADPPPLDIRGMIILAIETSFGKG